MAKLAQVLQAIEDGGRAILDKINLEREEFSLAIAAAKASGSEADLDAVLDRFNKFTSQISDSVVAIVPTVATPPVPSPVAEPTVLPAVELAAVEIPPVEVPVTIGETAEGAVTIEPAA